MINLNDMLQSAQGGQAVDHLAARFGLSPDQARSAVEAVLPALRMGLENKAADGSLGSLVGGGADVHRDAYVDAAAAQSPAAEQHGRSVLGGLFGGAGNTASVAQQAALQSGVPASIIQAMLPVIVSMVMGGLLHSAGGGGALGGLLSSILGSVLGGSSGSSSLPQSTGQGSGGFGGALGEILGGVLGGGAHPTAPAPMPSGRDGLEPAPASSNATLDEISGMFVTGTPPAPDHEAALGGILRR